MESAQQVEHQNGKNIEVSYQPTSGNLLLVDITAFITLVQGCFEAVNNKIKRERVKELLSLQDWFLHYQDQLTGRKVLSESQFIEHQHEIDTAKMLANVDYDVLFAPQGLFKRTDKRFDIYLLREHIILKADLKSITSKNPDTVANRIKGGSEQASRVVVNICSDIDRKALIDGLRSGVERNTLIKEVLLFYKSKYYRLPKDEILNKKIYKIL